MTHREKKLIFEIATLKRAKHGIWKDLRKILLTTGTLDHHFELNFLLPPYIIKRRENKEIKNSVKTTLMFLCLK